jgi:hypothetical protein
LATEKQIAANRANAKRSCGPKTLAGKLKSSQNAYRHGLSAPLRPDPVISDKANAIAQALAGEQPSEDRLASAAEFARAQLQLLQIRSTRSEMMAKLDLNSIATKELRRISALDRHERYCLTQRRRAAGGFDAGIGASSVMKGMEKRKI